MAKCDPKASRQSRDLDQVFSSPPSSQTGREALLQTRHLTIIASDRSFGNGDRPVLRAASKSSDAEEMQGFLHRGTVESDRVGDVAPAVAADESEKPVLQGSKGLGGVTYAHLAAVFL